MLKRLIPLSFAVAVSVACSMAEDAVGSVDSGGEPEFGWDDTGRMTDSDSPDVDDGVTSTPVWWRVSASLQVSEGALVLDTSTLSVSVWPAQPDATIGPLCSVDLALREATPGASPDADVAMSAWWELGTEPSAEATACLPASLLAGDGSLGVGLGLGTLDARLGAALTAQGLDLSAEDGWLYGAYVRHATEDSLWVFGWAGSDDNRAHAAAADPTQALADGVYVVAPLHVLPLP